MTMTCESFRADLACTCSVTACSRLSKPWHHGCLLFSVGRLRRNQRRAADSHARLFVASGFPRPRNPGGSYIPLCRETTNNGDKTYPPAKHNMETAHTKPMPSDHMYVGDDAEGRLTDGASSRGGQLSRIREKFVSSKRWFSFRVLVASAQVDLDYCTVCMHVCKLSVPK